MGAVYAQRTEQFNALTTAAVAGNGTTTTLLLNPGGGRYRIFACSLSPQYNNTGDIQARLQGASSVTSIWGGNTNNGAEASQGFFGDMGIALPTDADLTLFHRASVANQNFWMVVQYVWEQIY